MNTEKRDLLLNQNSFIQEYKAQMIESITSITNEYDEATIDAALSELVSKKVHDKTVQVYNEYTNVRQNVSLIDLLGEIIKNKPLIAGNGLLLKKHEKAKNLSAEMLIFLKESRSKYKKMMFKFIDNPSLKVLFDNYQTTFKILMNSYYGTMGEKNSFNYGEFTGPGVTGTGVIIITTAANMFENLFGNLIFKNFNDIIIFIKNVLLDKKINDSNYKNHYDEFYKDYTIDYTDVYTRLMKCYNGEELSENNKKTLEDLLKSYNNDQLCWLYFKNNFYEFLEMENDRIFGGKYNDINFTSSFLNIDDYFSEIESVKNSKELDFLKRFWDIVDTYVAHYHISENSLELLQTEKRKTVLVVDTDSNFIYLDPYYKIMKNRFVVDDNKCKISIINIMVYVTTLYIKKVFALLCTNLNIPDSYKHWISMKNEFLIERLFLTENKKSYLTKIICREGKILDKLLIDVKGLQLKKSNVSSKVRDYYKKLIDTEYFNQDINLPEIINEILKFQDEIYSDLNENRSLNYANTLRLNKFSTYSEPYRMQVVRGTLVWNALNPNLPILEGDKCNAYKIVGLENEQDLEKIEDESIREILREAVFRNEKMKNYGINVITFPKTLEKFPLWLKPFISIDEIIADNIRHGLSIIKSLGVHLIFQDQATYLSNTLEDSPFFEEYFNFKEEE
jgi:hypothetical protein